MQRSQEELVKAVVPSPLATAVVATGKMGDLFRQLTRTCRSVWLVIPIFHSQASINLSAINVLLGLASEGICGCVGKGTRCSTAKRSANAIDTRAGLQPLVDR